MKGIWKIGLVAGLLASTTVADVVFDLGAQQLYYPITKLADSDGFLTIDQYREASYDVGTAIVSTGLSSINGYYRPENYRSGNLGVQIKEPKAKSAVTFAMYCDLNNDGCSVQLLGKDGKALNIDFDYYDNAGNLGKISVAGEIQYGIGNYGTHISGAVEIDASAVHVTINGSYTFTVQKADFQLAKVNISLYTENAGYIDDIDKLTSLAVSNSD